MAVGVDITARVGSTVQITVGVKNTGPAASVPTGDPRFGPTHTFNVTLPAGADLIETHGMCTRPRITDTPGDVICLLGEIAPGASQLVTIDLRITAPIRTQGSVARIFRLGWWHPPISVHDSNPANDVAAIKISTGELPRTGTDTKTIAAVGGGVVVVGGLLLLAARRMSRRPGSRRG